jgi:hypothetical protein
MAETTALNLYRSCRIEQFPDSVMIDDEPAPGVLHPDFYDRPLPNGDVREVDIQVYLVKGVEWVGTGQACRYSIDLGYSPGQGGYLFPEGTPIPDSLIVANTGYNKRLKATHYQIEARAPMRKDAMEGALENFARSAVARSVELSRRGVKA